MIARLAWFIGETEISSYKILDYISGSEINICKKKGDLYERQQGGGGDA